MTPIDLDAITARATAATEGPWRVWSGSRVEHVAAVETAWSHDADGGDTELIADCCPIADAKFIAHARTDIPDLVAEVRRLRDENERLTDAAEDAAYPLVVHQGELLTAAANALRGDPPPLTSWSHHDIADLAAAAVAERDAALAAVERARAIHAPIEALNVRANRAQQVCTGCGTDDGNWQTWPCPTIRALDIRTDDPEETS